MRLRKAVRRASRRRGAALLLGAAVLAAPLVALNVAVAVLGSTVVFPLSPNHLSNKARAVGAYLRHRPTCLFVGHAPMASLIAEAEIRHKLPRGLLAALVEVESSGRVHRISPAGAMGPAQLVPDTARMLGVEDPFDPAANLEGSARYLAAQLARFRNVRLAVAAYNAGPGAVRGSVPRNGETEVYVDRVLRSFWARRRPPRPVTARIERG